MMLSDLLFLSFAVTAALRLHIDEAGSVSCAGGNGASGDGFGSQYQCRMAAYALSRHEHTCYSHTTFGNIVHGSFKKGFDPNTWTGLKSDDRRQCGTYGTHLGNALVLDSTAQRKNESIDEYWTQEVQEELRFLYRNTSKPEIDLSCEVAFHVRRGDVHGSDADAWLRKCDGLGDHKYHACRYVSNAQLYHVITANFKHQKVCIFSEGQKDNFGSVKELQNVKFILDGAVDDTFHALVAAPKMVMAHSSFSYAAGLLNSGDVYYITPFWHKSLKRWKQLAMSHSFARKAIVAGPKEDLLYDGLSDFD